MNPWLEILIIFVLPVVLWSLNILPAKFRAHALVVMGFIVGFFLYSQNWSWYQLGIRTDNLGTTLAPYLLVTMISIIFLWGFAEFSRRKFIWSWKVHPGLWFWVTTGSILQEFMYRGYLIPKLAEATSVVVLIILVNAFLYALAHIIYPEVRTNLPLIFIAGIMFAALYWFYPNLIWIAGMHMILNFTAGCFGFFTPNPEPHKI